MFLVIPTETKQQQQQQQDPLVWNETVSRIDAAYEGECKQPGENGVCFEPVEPALEIANSVWVDSASELNTKYQGIVNAFLYRTDFADESAGSIVNKWVKDSTRGLIDSMIDDGPIQGIDLLAINSIYLKATWVHQFMKRSTTQDLFYSSPSRITTTLSEAYFMHQVKEFQYSHTAIPGYQIIQLPFVGETLSMIVVLPTNDDLTLDSPSVVSTDLIDALPQLEKTRIALALPKFKFTSTYNDDLKSSLQSIGLTAPFNGGLCILKNDCSSFVSDIIQKTVIDVNEEGVEAAAVTVIISRTSGFVTIERPIEFLADHPFQFFIYDSNEELMIFEGQVGNPGIPEGSTEPTLKASHTDNDFWSTNFGVDVIVLDPFEDDTSITYSNAKTTETNNNN